jgi:7,8-dihydropterin-6-yl-methyl-4-(beta-D-ribofuranosyl)aminobenzene 5'-phosphate synthase
VIPTHCTGDVAKAAFRRAYGARCIDGGVGRAVDLGGLMELPSPSVGLPARDPP